MTKRDIVSRFGWRTEQELLIAFAMGPAAARLESRKRPFLTFPPLTSALRSWQRCLLKVAALTGSGKTPILADAVAQMRGCMVCEPLVLWISKSKAVVDQTRANFEPGGKYESLLEGFCGTSLGEASAALICDDTQPALIMATVGSFNQSAKGEGSLRVHQKAEDTGGAPLWETLATRTAPASPMRRPLIIVYDEGHNLADQQADLLLELEPDAILVASATMRTPSRLGQIINRLEQAGWSDRAIRDEPNRPQQGLVTALRSGDVVEAGLVKRQIILGGYPPMMLSFRYLRALNLVELLFRTRANCLNNTAPLGMSESASNLRLRWVTSWRKSRVSSQRKSTVKVVTPIADRLGNRLTLRQQHV